MAKENLLNTRTTNFLELIGNGRTYSVPPFQRDYSWGLEQWEDLWQDIVDLRGRPDDRHTMGCLVVEAKTDRELAVIDGQQRLATLSLLALAVIRRLRVLADAGTDPDANRDRAAALRTRFVGEKDPASLVVTDDQLQAPREATTLDRVHAAMLLQRAGRANALRALLQDEVSRGPEFLRLANALSALYPRDSEEKRLLDAMLLAVPR